MCHVVTLPHLNTLAALLLNLSLTELSSKLSTRQERMWGRWTWHIEVRKTDTQ